MTNESLDLGALQRELEAATEQWKESSKRLREAHDAIDAAFTRLKAEAPRGQEWMNRAATDGPAAPRRGALKKEVRHLALSSAGWFNGYEITDKLRREGFPLVGRNTTISVMEILREMVDSGLLIMRKGGRDGSANAPNVFCVRKDDCISQE